MIFKNYDNNDDTIEYYPREKYPAYKVLLWIITVILILPGIFSLSHWRYRPELPIILTSGLFFLLISILVHFYL
jgi:hypothetical protein